MSNASKILRKLLASESMDARVYRVDMDRVDVTPTRAGGILRSLPITGDRDKIKPGDPVKVLNIAGERVVMAADVATDPIQALVHDENVSLPGLGALQVGEADRFDSLRDKVGFTFVMDGSGANISTGQHGYIQFPFPMRFTSVDLLANAVGNVTVAVTKTTYATWGTPVSVGSLSIASANKNTYDLDSAWEVAEGDQWTFDLTVNSASARISLCFRGYRL